MTQHWAEITDGEARARGMTMDEHYPREPWERYVIYRLRKGSLAELASSPTAEGIGLALVTLHDEGEWDSRDDAVGVKDTHGDPQVPGTWIVNPYARGGV